MVSSTEGWPHEDLLEPALQGGVLLDVLAVLVEGGGPDQPQLAPGQHRLDHVAGVHGPLGRRRRPTMVCSSSMKVMTSPSASVISLSTAFSRSSNSPRYLAPATIEPRSRAMHPLALQALGHVALDDPLGQALDDGRLAHAGLADEDRVVLGPPGQHLDDPADLLVPADDRVELALAGQLGQVPAVLLEGLEGLLGVLAR